MAKTPFATAELTAARNADDKAREITDKAALKLAAKKAEIERLEEERDELSLPIIMDEEGAQEKYDDLDAAVDKAKAELGVLEKGVEQAQRLVEKAEAQRRVAERRQLRKKARRLKLEQAKAARDLVENLERARHAMRKMQELGASVAAMLPGVPTIDWMYLAPRAIKQAVEGEIWRQAYTDSKAGQYLNNDYQWPAGKRPGAELTGKRPTAGVPESDNLLDLEALVKRSARDVDDILCERRHFTGGAGPRAGEPDDPLDDEESQPTE